MKKNEHCELPPLGVKPRKLWDEERFLDLSEAISRYMVGKFPIPLEWVEEYNELIKNN